MLLILMKSRKYPLNYNKEETVKVWILALPLVSCVTLDMFLNLSELQFLCLQWNNDANWGDEVRKNICDYICQEFILYLAYGSVNYVQ